MNRLFLLLLYLMVLAQLKSVSCQNNTQVYSINLELKNAPTGEKVFLQKYIGIKQVVIDSLQVGSNTELFFYGDKPLVPGMYALSYNRKLLANFFISNPDNQNFRISLDLKNPSQTLTFIGSSENQTFIDYLRFLNSQQQKGELEKASFEEKGLVLQTQFPGSMLALFICSLREPKIPVSSKPLADKRVYEYYYLTNHFFDNIDFEDKRLLNTPILEQKIGIYFRQMVPPVVDSIKVRVNQVIGEAKANKEVYTWAVRYLYQLYRESPIPGNTEVYNFIGEQFIINDIQRWNDTAFVEKVRERVAKAKLNPIGSLATNLKLQTPEGKLMDLNSVVASETILLFFNPGCEACHAVTEKLVKIYQQYKSKGIQVFAVYIDHKKDEWQSYISAKGLDWINVYDPAGSEGIEQKYDIYAIPMLYLLDKDKKVIVKDIPVEKLEEYLQ